MTDRIDAIIEALTIITILAVVLGLSVAMPIAMGGSILFYLGLMAAIGAVLIPALVVAGGE